MNVCPYCQGLVRIEQPRKIVNLQVYHLHCGFKQEKIDDSKKLSCTHCFKRIEGAYKSLFVKHIRMDFHPDCEPIFRKEVLGENRIPKG
jgi:hypothetical protein